MTSWRKGNLLGEFRSASGKESFTLNYSNGLLIKMELFRDITKSVIEKAKDTYIEENNLTSGEESKLYGGFLGTYFKGTFYTFLVFGRKVVAVFALDRDSIRDWAPYERNTEGRPEYNAVKNFLIEASIDRSLFPKYLGKGEMLLKG